MKKRLVLVLAFVVCFTFAFAQKKQMDRISTHGSQKMEEKIFKADFSKIKENATMIVSERGNKGDLVIKAPQAALSYAKPEGTYHGTFWGENNELGGAYPFIHGKAFYDWKFVASGGSDYQWKLVGATGSVSLETDALGNGIYNLPCGSYLLPTVTSGSQSYIWHDAVGERFGSVSDDIHYLSMVDMWKDSDNQGFSNLGAFSDYGYGVGSSSSSTSSEYEACAQIYNAPQAPLFIESVNATIFSNNNTPLPGNNFLKCTIYPVSSNGTTINWNSPIATSECYANDLEDWGSLSSDGKKIFNAPFYFYEYDPTSELETLMNLTISTAFVVLVEWTSGANLGFVWGFSDGDGQDSFVIAKDGETYSYSYRDQSGTVIPVDLYINVRGVMNTLSLNEQIESISIPVEGGSTQVVYGGDESGTYINVILNSSLQSDILVELEHDLPEWLDIVTMEDLTVTTGGTEYFANAISVIFEGDALPSGMTGRKAEVTLNSYGTTSTFSIVQGDAEWLPPTAITFVKTAESAKVSRQGDDFLLSYPASATSVSVYNVTGQRMGEYKLNASGTYTLPAANLANGVYVLKFNGANTTVKIVK
jgi:hypothetical protein